MVSRADCRPRGPGIESRKERKLIMVVEEMEKELRELELLMEVEETFLEVEYLLEVKKSDSLQKKDKKILEKKINILL